ncbi:RIP metalloprotease RseP [Thiomicrospira microaerophila]|uniref:RIP metalloprotease RseP n=1 Tax=Thiomicrospira microaerophila TaxID=406020 RepID=UPI00200D1920|nr:RIP metalloprotease RseP [Thiomicrospira microaerophila]UQB41377.1 RIP metalloprotease RseP [Thiomicrospira microaerophila]
MSFFWALIGFAILIGVLVTIHEWGHFAVARLFNVKVLQFSVGFGKPLYRFQRGETEYRLAMIPLGGYVKFLDERVEPVAEYEKHRSFNQQSVYKRFAIVLAGPMINLLFAWWLFAIIGMIGIQSTKPIFQPPQPNTPLSQAFSEAGMDVVLSNQQAWWLHKVNDQPISSWQQVQQMILQSLVHDQMHVELEFTDWTEASERFYNVNLPLATLDINDLSTPWLSRLGFVPQAPRLEPIIGQLSSGSAAEIAGLRSGDRVVELGGIQIEDWADLVQQVRQQPDLTLELVYERDNARFSTDVKLESVSLENGDVIGRLGASVLPPDQFDSRYLMTERYGLVDAAYYGWQQTVRLFNMTIAMFKKMLTGQVGLQHLSGPISIADFSGKALQTGLISFLSLMALLSLSLGILNLLPIPMLDGGHLMFYFYEMLRGKPVSERVEEVAYRIGLVMIAGLTVLALSNDVIRITNG